MYFKDIFEGSNYLLAPFSTNSFQCIFIMNRVKYMKIFSRFISIEVVAIWNFTALGHVTLKPLLQMQEKVARIHGKHIDEETYRSCFSFDE